MGKGWQQMVLPPLALAVAGLAGAFALHATQPPLPFVLPEDGEAARAGIIVMGSAMVTAGALLFALGARELANAGTPTAAGARPTVLVDSGVFAFSRNPMFVGQVCGLLGVSVVMNSLYGLLCANPLLLYCGLVAVPAEERALQAAFDKDYKVYCGRVRRWM